MASKNLAQNLLRCSATASARLVSTIPRTSFLKGPIQSQALPATYRYLHVTRAALADVSKPAEAITTPQAKPPPEEESEANKNAAYLGEADSDDGFEAHKAVHGDPQPALDAKNSAFLGEADSDDGFESRKDIDGEKLEAVDATNSAYLGEADSDDGFVAHRDAHPEEADHGITDPVESGLHGQAGEQDR